MEPTVTGKADSKELFSNIQSLSALVDRGGVLIWIILCVLQDGLYSAGCADL